VYAWLTPWEPLRTGRTGAAALAHERFYLCPESAPERGPLQPLQVIQIVSGDLAQRPTGISTEVKDGTGRVSRRRPRSIGLRNWSGAERGLYRPGLRGCPCRCWCGRAGGPIARRRRLRAALLGARCVVGRSPDGVAQHVPRVVQRDHPRRVTAKIRVVLAREHSIRGSDDLRLRARLDLQHFVGIAHGRDRTASPMPRLERAPPTSGEHVRKPTIAAQFRPTHNPEQREDGRGLRGPWATSVRSAQSLARSQMAGPILPKWRYVPCGFLVGFCR